MNIRELAFHSLVTIFRDDGYSNIVVSQTIQKHPLEDRDRRFYTELVYGTVRHLNFLNWIISRLSTRKLSALDPVCLAILRLGLYQIFCLSRVPDSAACNESVKLATKFGNAGMAKFVNAILRSSIRRREEFVIPSADENLVAHLALTYHQENWLIRKWIHDYGEADAIKICQYFDMIPDICIRANTAKISRDELLQKLQDEGFQAVPTTYSRDGIYLKGTPALNQIKALREGLAIIQDEPSQLVGPVVDPQPGDVIFDVCAAPGGKTTHLAALGGPTCTVYGCDIYNHKLKLIEQNGAKLGLTNMRTLLQDGQTIGDKYAEKADKVLVDAPCSGLGVLRRKLDLRWRKKESDVEALPKLQRRILDSAAKCVKPGGLLVYSTCTMNDGENKDVVNAFLQNHPEFHAEPAGPYCHVREDGPYVQILPQRDGIDGFFIARMRKGSTE